MAIQQKNALTSQSINQCIRVTFNYNVHFTRGLLQLDNPLLAQVIAPEGERTPKQVLVVVDGGFLHYQDGLLEKLSLYAQCYEDVITLGGEPMVVPGGEAVKNDSRFIEQIHQRINAIGLCRHSYVLAIGGGALLDMAGYAATTAHRGIRLLRAKRFGHRGKERNQCFWQKKLFGYIHAPLCCFE
jgi:3-dehydroquinate synthase